MECFWSTLGKRFDSTSCRESVSEKRSVFLAICAVLVPPPRMHLSSSPVVA